MRGAIYLREGAIERHQLSADGRHVHELDTSSWHVVSLKNDGSIAGCARFRTHDPGVHPEDLNVWKSIRALGSATQGKLRKVLTCEIESAARRNLGFAELGGWAVAEDLRCTSEALRIALSMYALSWTLGCYIGVTTATVRNHSAGILRRLGGTPLEIDGHPMPRYYDPQYECEMELLRFDSRVVQAKYSDSLDGVLGEFGNIPVIHPRVAEMRGAPTLEPFQGAYCKVA
jgi:hypothetical protein